MPKFGGMFAVAQIRQLRLPTKILIFTMHELPGMESVLRATHCNGLVLKGQADRDLLRGVRAILHGGEFFSSPVARSQTA